MDENGREKIEHGIAGGFAATSVRNAASTEGWQPQLLDKGKVVFGHKSGRPLPGPSSSMIGQRPG